MLTLADLADTRVLRACADPATIERGRSYARSGAVIDLDVALNRDGVVLQSSVAGSGAAAYQTVVSARSDAAGEIEVYTACSCPVHRACKHAVATVIVASQGQASATPGLPAWERALSDLLDDTDEPRGTGASGRAVALRFEAATRRRLGKRFGASTRPGRPELRLRPVLRGARGRWVKTGIGWRDLVYLDPRGGSALPPAHVEVLRSILATQRSRLGSYGTGDDTLSLADLGPGLWRLLDEAVEAGLPLVADGFAEVRLAPAPATLRLDAHRTDEGARLVPGAVAGDLWTPAEDLRLLGDPGHGLALWTGEGADAVVTLAALDRPPTRALRELVLAGEPVDVPADDLGAFVGDYLPRVAASIPVVSLDDSIAIPEPPVPHLVLSVSWVSDTEVDLAWSWHYRAEQMATRVHPIDDPAAPYGLRDLGREERILDGLRLGAGTAALLCGETDRGSRPYAHLRLRGPDVIAFATEVLGDLRGHEGFEIVEDGAAPDFTEVRGRPEIRFDAAPVVEGRSDWFDLEVVVTIGGEQVALAQIIEALATGQDKILLHKGKYVSVDNPALDALARTLADARALTDQPRRDGVRVPRQAFDLWDELDELGVVDDQARRWTTAARALAGTEGVPEVAEPPGLKATLRSYQREGYHWLSFLYDHGLGGILADDMGLGKTVQALAAILRARTAGAGPPFLVVAPTSVVATWAEQAAQFAPDLDVRTVTESHARRGVSLATHVDGADLVITSYTLVRIEADAYADLDWSGLVLDEAQAVKNHRSKTHQALHRIATAFTVAITGTPMENDLMELWSLLSLTAPGLFPAPDWFRHEIAAPIEKGGDVELLASLQRRIRPLVLRRTKELVAADLPPKQEQVLEVPLPGRHQRIYDTHLQRERQRALQLIAEAEPGQAENQRRMTLFAALTRLRQLSLDPGLVDERYDTVGSAKLDVLVEHLHELVAEGHRALVFSQFTSYLARVRARLDAEGLAHAYLDGSTRDRAGVVSEFRGGDVPVFLVSLKAGGVGLTLTEADYVFLLDPWWNPAVEAQAVDRAHRIGQHRSVMVYRLVAVGTVEEKVMELKARKAELFNSVLDGDGMLGGGLDESDLRGLLGA